MKIAFFGSSLLSAYWNGAATYYRGIIRALHARGHEVTFYEPDAFDRQTHRDIQPPTWARSVVYENTQAALDVQLEAAAKADLIIKASGVGVFDAYLEEAVLCAKSDTTLVAFWDVDAPATLSRVLENANDAFRQHIPGYDLILTYGGGEPVMKDYALLGARECVPIYNALDPSTHHPVTDTSRFRSDLGFLGNRLPDREARVQEFFFKPAQARPPRQFLLGGSGWQDLDYPDNVRYAGHVYTADHNAFNCGITFALNISRSSMADYGFSPATRVFEAAGAGACIITDYWMGIEQFFTPDEEILVAQTGQEVAECLDRISVERAREIGRAALARALAEHTYAHRAEQLEQTLEGAMAS